MKASPRRTCTPEECHGRIKREDFIGYLSGMVDVPNPPRSTSREAQRGASCTLVHSNMAVTAGAAQTCTFFANVQWLGHIGHVHIRHHPTHPPVHMRAPVILTP